MKLNKSLLVFPFILSFVLSMYGLLGGIIHKNVQISILGFIMIWVNIGLVVFASTREARE